MHECPECGFVCDCDQEDTWHESGSAVDDCCHDCEPDRDGRTTTIKCAAICPIAFRRRPVRTLQEQIAGKCVHFTGLMNDTCKAGVKYSDVQLDHAPIAYTRDGVTYSSSLSLLASRRTIAAAHRVLGVLPHGGGGQSQRERWRAEIDDEVKHISQYATRSRPGTASMWSSTAPMCAVSCPARSVARRLATPERPTTATFTPTANERMSLMDGMTPVLLPPGSQPAVAARIYAAEAVERFRVALKQSPLSDRPTITNVPPPSSLGKPTQRAKPAAPSRDRLAQRASIGRRRSSFSCRSARCPLRPRASPGDPEAWLGANSCSHRGASRARCGSWTRPKPWRSLAACPRM